MISARPFLMFQQGMAASALAFWADTLPDAHIVSAEYYGDAGPGPAGTIMRATFAIGDQQVMVTDSFITHDFGFNPSFSFWVECGSQDELHRLAAALGEGGSVLMPAGNYGFSQLFTWVTDRFGISWQLNSA